MGCVSVVSILLSVCAAFASAAPSGTGEKMAKENLQKLALANNELAFNLYRNMVSGSTENLFFSPLSISTAFAMLYYGAKGNTAQELRQALGYEKADIKDDTVHDTFKHFLSQVLKSKDSSDGYVLNSANALLVDKNLELIEEYRSEVQDLYKAAVRDVDFSNETPKVVKEINSWVREKTNGKIEKILNELSPSTILVLLNAVYFKGSWKTPFDTTRTKDKEFYNNGLESSKKKVPFMHLESKFNYTYVENYHVLELPYEGENVSMLIILPKERDGLQAVENSLTPKKLSDIQKIMFETEVEVFLPKFKIQFEKELSPEMQALGAKQIFSPGSADFSGMTPSKSVFLSQILHKAVIEVNEEGSEAASVTAGIVAYSLSPEFIADHPFLFAIVEKGSSSNMILFLGRVNSF